MNDRKSEESDPEDERGKFGTSDHSRHAHYHEIGRMSRKSFSNHPLNWESCKIRESAPESFWGALDENRGFQSDDGDIIGRGEAKAPSTASRSGGLLLGQ